MIIRWHIAAAVSTLIAIIPAGVSAGNIISNNGFSSCGRNADIRVDRLDIKYDKTTRQVTFDAAGTSTKTQQVTARLTVTAFGQQVYKRDFDPCDAATRVNQLCPGSFAAQGVQTVPEEYAKQIPDIAFNVPDLDGMAKLELKAKDTGAEVACVQSQVGNGKTITTTTVPIVAAGIAGAALALSGISSIAASGTPGMTGPSPSFGEVIGWFQSMAMNGMLSVNYPPIYRSFSRNFGFSGGLVSWDFMQRRIDAFRAKTGGNLDGDSVDFLRTDNLAFVYSSNFNGTLTRRSINDMNLWTRAADPVNGNEQKLHSVQGIQAFVEPLIIPKSNTFMTALLFLAVIVAAIIVGILLFKIILEAAALMGRLSKGLNTFRERYWWVMAKTITNLILLLYGIWTLYCIYQFTQGDSWVAKLLAGLTLGIFTGILLFFTWRIWSIASKFKKLDGDASGLYDDKETWRNYSIFYDSYKKDYWWVFVPVILYMFARGVIIAAGDGHGLFQTIGQLILEFLMLLMLAFFRPYSRRSGNWINITIQVVRLLSILCILVFVDQLGISKTPQTVTGLILVIMQTLLTGLLAILILINCLLACCRTNPYEKARKAAQRDRDTLTPLNTLDYDPLASPPLPQSKQAQQQYYEKSSSSSSTNSSSNKLQRTSSNSGKHSYSSSQSRLSYGYDPEVTNPNQRPQLDVPQFGYATPLSDAPVRGPVLPRVSLPRALRISRQPWNRGVPPLATSAARSAGGAALGPGPGPGPGLGGARPPPAVAAAAAPVYRGPGGGAFGGQFQRPQMQMGRRAY